MIAGVLKLEKGKKPTNVRNPRIGPQRQSANHQGSTVKNSGVTGRRPVMFLEGDNVAWGTDRMFVV